MLWVGSEDERASAKIRDAGSPDLRRDRDLGLTVVTESGENMVSEELSRGSGYRSPSPPRVLCDVNRTVIVAPSGSRRMLNGNPVFATSVRLGLRGRDNGASPTSVEAA